MTQKKKKTCNMNTQKNDVIISQALRKEKQVQHFPEGKPKVRLLQIVKSQLTAKTKSLNKDCLKQSFEILCLTFTTRFKFDNYFLSFIDYFSGLVFAYCNRLYVDLQINESHLYLLPAIMINIKQERVSQKISFKQPSKITPWRSITFSCSKQQFTCSVKSY